jgi:hypothetical protein
MIASPQQRSSNVAACRRNMCSPSVVADDWIVKGCHIEVNGVELAVRPDHRGTVVFRPVFSSVPSQVVDRAIGDARRDCLTDPNVRRQWIAHIERAMVHLFSQTGVLQPLARGRLAELRFLRSALNKMDA